jgi:hypothetical protein
MGKIRRLVDEYSFPGLRQSSKVEGKSSNIGAVALTLALFVLSACGGGGGSGTSSGGTPSSLAATPVSYVLPDNGAPVTCCAVEFVLRNGYTSKYTGGVYTITLYGDEAGLETLGTSDALAEDESGEARWTPSVTLDENRAYWWQWTAKYNEKTVSSKQGVFYVTTKNALKAMAPRHTGWMDANFAGKPMFSVFNAYTGEGASVSYDIELYADESLSNMLTSVAGLSQENNRYTAWYPNMSALNSGGVYYWRVRAAMNGFATEWGGPYSFTVKDPCAITGDKYASYAIDWHSDQYCPELLLTDPIAALGLPDASGGGGSWANFISLGLGGEMTLEMGATVIDQPGADIRVYQYVSTEPTEVLVGPTEVGPWYSLGAAWCGDTCDFDLAYAGVAYARYIRIRDLWSPARPCYETGGTDIDAVMWISPITNTGGCGAFGGTVVSSTPAGVTDPFTHTAPEWIKGDWNLIEIGRGTRYTGFTFSVTDTEFEYSYPGCYVKGRLSMDPALPMAAVNGYTLIMDQVDCSEQWDISTAVGSMDTGNIWATEDGQTFYRSSFNIDIRFWVYTR